MKVYPDLSLELTLKQQGYNLIAGVDEAGRGPLAGPVVAAAVILPNHWQNPGVDDSKRLTPAKRESLAKILAQSVPHAWGLVSAAEIDKINIHQASLLAMQRAIAQLNPDFVLLDGRFIIEELKLPQQALIKGDSRSCSVAAASILAKVRRDELMRQLHLEYPAYNFAVNKGYPTPQHLEALHALGPCPEHRKSYGPVANLRLL